MDERRELVGPLIERVYVDIGSRRIGAITPAPQFGSLLAHAVRAAPDAAVHLLPRKQVERRQEILVEMGGLEPPTSALRTQRSPN